MSGWNAIRGLICAVVLVLGATRIPAQTLETRAGAVRVETVLSGLDVPWALDFLPDGGFLVTQRGGVLLYVRDGRARRVAGTPAVWARGQGGLLDVTVARDFAATGEVFLTFARRQGGGASTALAVARLDTGAARLRDLRVIFQAQPGSGGGRHFGSRVIEAPDGKLFLTLGERGDAASAQDRSSHNGSILRLARDGSAPADNPFAGQQGMRPEIWSYGHRNPQGAALDATGRLWAVEHGARGGDEINRIRRGANFGWPVRSIRSGTAIPFGF